jgi:hypothetical protein
MKLGFVLAAAAAAAFVAAPASADWAPGRSGAAPMDWGATPAWHGEDAFPTTPPIQRFGKGYKGVRRFGRSLVREAEFRRWREDAIVLRPAAARLEDSRGRCDRLLKDALERGDQAEIEEKREYCRPKAYGPHTR